MATQLAMKGAKLMMHKEFKKNKDKPVAGDDDPFFTYVTKPNGKRKKVGKQIPDFIPTKDAEALARAKKWAYRWDMGLFNACGFRFGWSSAIGLVPELGDVIDLFMAIWVVTLCTKVEGLPSKIKAMFLLHIIIDFFVGLIPIVGDFADAAYRCNTKNVMMVEEFLLEKHGPKKMSIKEKRHSRLEPLDDSDTEEGKFGHEYPPVHEPRQPEEVHKDGKTSRWFGQKKRGTDLEAGHQSARR